MLGINPALSHLALVLAECTADRLAQASHAGGQLDTSQSLETLSTLSRENLRFLVVSNVLSLVLFTSPLLPLGKKNKCIINIILL